MKRRAIAVMPILIWAVAGFGHAAPPPSNKPPLPCVPPLVASPAGCTFNIYGYITDQFGNPVAGVSVSDGSPPNAISDASGFYDLYEMEAGISRLTYSHPTCARDSDDVPVTPHGALLEGGKRHDAQVLCNG